jgi:hypothetical protein
LVDPSSLDVPADMPAHADEVIETVVILLHRRSSLIGTKRKLVLSRVDAELFPIDFDGSYFDLRIGGHLLPGR